MPYQRNEKYLSEIEIWLNLKDTLLDDYQGMFFVHEATHPEFYNEFERRALDAIALGKEHHARKIAQDMRCDSGWRFHDSVIAFYARRFISKHPEHRHYFRLRDVTKWEVDNYCLK